MIGSDQGKGEVSKTKLALVVGVLMRASTIQVGEDVIDMSKHGAQVT